MDKLEVEMALPRGSAAMKLWARQSWLPFVLRDRILRLFVNPDRQAPQRFECDFLGLRYGGDLANFIDWTVFFYGAYEPGLLRFFTRVAAASGGAEGAVFLDVGANVGLHSLYMAPRVARVHAFEPWAPARVELEAKISSNRLGNVVVHPFGLSDLEEHLPYFEPGPGNGGTGSFVPGCNLTNRPAEPLELRRGDAVMEELAPERIDLVKIDTEGFEYRVLAGLRRTIARFRPVVAFELSPSAAERMPGGVAAALARVFGSGWEFRVLEETSGGQGRIIPFLGKADGAMVLVIPQEKAAALLL